LATSETQIKDNVERVQERIAEACRRAGRRPKEVTLVAVSKTVPPERIRVAYNAGVRHFGENRVQEAVAKRPALSDLSVTWHFIGHLQSNKAKTVRELFHCIHSVDSVRLAEKLNHAAVCDGDRLPVLIEVNLGDETTKSGIDESEVVMLASAISRLGTLELRGLMAVPPFFDNPQKARPFFRRLRELAVKIENTHLENILMRDLSIGMSHDFEVAVEEGATIVRVGTAIFGARQDRGL
jgi:pyridoxal phosphate enzyme (YggS family)